MIISENNLRNILSFAKGLKFGEIIIKVQDSSIVSVEKHEKFRLNKNAGPGNGEADINN